MSRVQTGVRIDKGVLKVLKALAEYEEVSLGALLESIVLHSFRGEMPFDEGSLVKISELCSVYGLELELDSTAREVQVVAPDAAQEGEQGDSLTEALDGLSRMLEAGD